MGAPETTSADTFAPSEGRRHEVIGILTAAVTVLMALSLFSYDAQGGENLVGPVGTGIAGLLAAAFGVGAWVLPVELGLATTRLFSRRSPLLGIATVASTFVIVLVCCAMLHLLLAEQTVFGGHLAGGVLGEVLGEVLRSLVGLAGAYVVGATVLLVTLVLRTPVSLADSIARGGKALRGGAMKLKEGTLALGDAWREARELEKAEREAARDAAQPRIVAGDDDDDWEDDDGEALIVGEDPEDEDEPDEPEPEPVRKASRKKRKKKGPAKQPEVEPVDGLVEALEDEQPEPPKAKSKAKARVKAKKTEGGPTIVAPVQRKPEAAEPVQLEIDARPVRGNMPFILPPTSLLDPGDGQAIPVDPKVLRETAARLTQKLADYKINGRVDEIHPGPVVTMYEFEPQSGTKVSTIARLADDLAMAMAVEKVRIVAPIPGKARVGFELPNKKRQMVRIREVLEDDRWRSIKANLPVAFGKDIAGQPVYGDLSKMPHLLVAGATGSGKSVGLNVMLCSLLAKMSPEECRMLMIDPKVVELAVFDGIPHMLLPVVTDMKKAALALRWAVDEMERRYQLFADAGARNINTYNQRVEKVIAGEMPVEKLSPRRKGKVKGQGPNGEEVLLPPDGDEAPDALEMPDKLPFVVVVVDEFADLMMVSAKDVEACIARLAQKARAAGIHVILATQRPSVDVITGMIKANFPSRMAFKVSQREDSKTILGRMGAEHLLGMGDMLMLPPGSSDLKRVHSAYISEDEVKDMCDFLREQGTPVYDTDILKPRDDDDGIGGQAKSEDPIYDKAVAVVAQAGYCSISHIQRQLSVGYNKAAKLVDRMEKEGVVGPAASKAGGRREVLIQSI